MNIAVLFWEPDSTLSEIHVNLIEGEGHQVTKFMWNAPLPSDIDAVFVHGPFGSMVPIANQLLELDSDKRPELVLWMSEQFWNPNIPNWLGQLLSRMRSRLERSAYHQLNGVWQPKKVWEPALRFGARFRYFGDILWLQTAGILTLLAVPSQWTHRFLTERGVESILAFNGYNSEWGHKMELERDIDVLWLGTHGSQRRRLLLQKLRQELKQRGIELMMIDGQEHPPVHGEERTKLLNRTKVVLNLLRQSWDSNYLRYLLAMSNGAMVVTEPTYQHAPFQANEHIAVSPIDQLADMIAHYCSNEPERLAIAERAHRFITTELTLQNSMSTILEKLQNFQNREVTLET